jgi:hypothetical protein
MRRIHCSGRTALILALAMAPLSACKSSNPVGFWDIVSLEIEWGGDSQVQEDVGTMEWTENDTVDWVLRYDIVRPAEGVDDWTEPLSPPLLGAGAWDKNTLLTIMMDDLSILNAHQTRYKGTEMTYTVDEDLEDEDDSASAYVGDTSTPVYIVLELAR